MIEASRLHRRKNGMANIFAGIDIAQIEHLTLQAASGSTPSTPSSNSTAAPAVQISYDCTSLNCDDSSNHDSDDNNDDSSDSQDR